PGRHEDPDHVPSPTASRYRLRIRFDAVDKVLTGQLQWFLLMEVRDVAVAVMIRILKFSERVVVRRTFYACIVDANFLACPQIIIDDHAARTDDSHLAYFSWLEPAALDGCKAFAREGERLICYIVYSRDDMS